MKKLLAFLIFAVTFSFPALAGEWKQDAAGYWWQDDDGNYPAGTWQWIDGNQDGTAECYYFDENGYLLTGTATPDGYTVDSNGCWIVDGVIQTQAAQTGTAGQDGQDATALSSGAAFDFSTDNIAMKYVSHELGTDYDGNSCVIIYYDYTNKSADPASALWTTMIRVSQNGEPCTDAFLPDGTNQPFEDYYIETAPGATVRVAEAFVITDRSDITVKVYEFLGEENHSQTITLKLQ